MLNDLPPHPHNAFVKLFASREQEREAAFAALDSPQVTMTPQLHAYMLGLQETLEVKGEINMTEILTADKIMEIGEKIRQRVLETATPEEKLAGLDPKDILAGFEPQDILAELKPQERLAGLTHEERRLLLRLLQEELGTPSGEEANSNGDACMDSTCCVVVESANDVENGVIFPACFPTCRFTG